jgi:hypothetical protein
MTNIIENGIQGHRKRGTNIFTKLAGGICIECSDKRYEHNIKGSNSRFLWRMSVDTSTISLEFVHSFQLDSVPICCPKSIGPKALRRKKRPRLEASAAQHRNYDRSFSVSPQIHWESQMQKRWTLIWQSISQYTRMRRRAFTESMSNLRSKGRKGSKLDETPRNVQKGNKTVGSRRRESEIPKWWH